jgi:hypothetical protein
MLPLAGVEGEAAGAMSTRGAGIANATSLGLAVTGQVPQYNPCLARDMCLARDIRTHRGGRSSFTGHRMSTSRSTTLGGCK